MFFVIGKCYDEHDKIMYYVLDTDDNDINLYYSDFLKQAYEQGTRFENAYFEKNNFIGKDNLNLTLLGDVATEDEEKVWQIIPRMCKNTTLFMINQYGESIEEDVGIPVEIALKDMGLLVFDLDDLNAFNDSDEDEYEYEDEEEEIEEEIEEVEDDFEENDEDSYDMDNEEGESLEDEEYSEDEYDDEDYDEYEGEDFNVDPRIIFYLSTEVKEYYKWFTKSIYSSLMKKNNEDLSPQKLANLFKLTSIKKDGDWEFDGLEDLAPEWGKCTLGHPIRYAYYAYDNITRETIVFGSTCASDFFHLDEEALKIMVKAKNIMNDEILTASELSMTESWKKTFAYDTLCRISYDNLVELFCKEIAKMITHCIKTSKAFPLSLLNLVKTHLQSKKWDFIKLTTNFDVNAMWKNNNFLDSRIAYATFSVYDSYVNMLFKHHMLGSYMHNNGKLTLKKSPKDKLYHDTYYSTMKHSKIYMDSIRYIKLDGSKLPLFNYFEYFKYTRLLATIDMAFTVFKEKNIKPENIKALSNSRYVKDENAKKVVEIFNYSSNYYNLTFDEVLDKKLSILENHFDIYYDSLIEYKELVESEERDEQLRLEEETKRNEIELNDIKSKALKLAKVTYDLPFSIRNENTILSLEKVTENLRRDFNTACKEFLDRVKFLTPYLQNIADLEIYKNAIENEVVVKFLNADDMLEDLTIEEFKTFSSILSDAARMRKIQNDKEKDEKNEDDEESDDFSNLVFSANCMPQVTKMIKFMESNQEALNKAKDKVFILDGVMESIVKYNKVSEKQFNILLKGYNYVKKATL